MPRQPVTGGEDQPLLLAGGNAGSRPAIVGAGATAHFDEHRGCPVAADQIDLAPFDAKVAFQHSQSVCDKIVGGSRFAGIADLLGGAGGTVGDNCGHERIR